MKVLNSWLNQTSGWLYNNDRFIIGNITNFNKLLTDKLFVISSENKTILHMGDFNLDLLKSDTHPLTSEFNDINVIHSLFPSINKPTRVTPTSATIIDNIFTNYLDASKLSTSILITDISDHFPICFFSHTLTISQCWHPPKKGKKEIYHAIIWINLTL